MNNKYICPYCGHTSSTYTSWKSVRGHTSICKLNNHTVVVTELYGPLSYEVFINNTLEDLHDKYPGLNINNCTASLKKYKIIPTNFRYSKWPKHKLQESIKNFFIKNNRLPTASDFINNSEYPSTNTVLRFYGTWEAAILDSGLAYTPRPSWDTESIIDVIQKFVLDKDHIPKLRDFKYSKEYPDPDTVQRYFGSWNKAIEAAGFKPNIQNGFGINTVAKDGQIYRSAHEAYFVNTYLYGKYDYVIEPKYPSPYSYYYDWYIPSLDLYIELDGGCRPYRIKEKLAINEAKGINCIFINTDNLYNKPYVSQLLDSSTPFINVK